MGFFKNKSYNAIKKALAAFFLLFTILIVGCAQTQQQKPFCGDNICQENEKQNCPADCGGFQGITKLQCTQSKGNWNDCGSPCAGTGAKFCIEVCSPQCECGGIAGFNCPAGFKCRLTGKIADEFGVCIKE